MSRTVLFAGGPLHGTTTTVSDGGGTVMAAEPLTSADLLTPYDPLDPSLSLPRQVAYNMSRFAMLGRIIWIGHLGAKPDEDLVFEVLTSDGAKAASYVSDQADA